MRAMSSFMVDSARRRVRQTHLLQHRLETRIAANGIQTRAPDLHRLGDGMICCKVFQSVKSAIACAQQSQKLCECKRVAAQRDEEGEEKGSNPCTPFSARPGSALPPSTNPAPSGPD